MIIIGYQGIGKSTLTKKNNGYIDLESGNFWWNGQRPHNWYIYYCQIAEDLSRQGYIVFVSSHKEVREFLKKSKEKVIVVFPSILIKDKWVKKLKDRYEESKKEKDFKAWKNAEDRYKENIDELMRSEFYFIEINDLNYDLKEMIKDGVERLMEIGYSYEELHIDQAIKGISLKNFWRRRI